MDDLRDQLRGMGESGERLLRALRSGEEVLWVGRPHRVGYSILRSWMLLRYVALACVAALVLSNVPIFVTTGFTLCATLTFFQIRSELNSTIYIATQNRLMVFRRKYYLLNGLQAIGANGLRSYDRDSIGLITYYRHRSSALSMFIYLDGSEPREGFNVKALRTIWGLLSNTYIPDHLLLAMPPCDIERWQSAGRAT